MQGRPGDTSQASSPTAPTNKWLVLGVVGGGVFMVTLDMGMVNVALPTLAREFNAPLVATQWIVLGYALCITGLLLPMGRLADIVGRKRIFLGGYVIFTAASVLTALAPSLALMIAARVVQGIGGAMMQSNSSGLVTQAFPAEQRGRALGLNMAFVSSGLLSGPVIGGLLIEWLGWHALFFVNIPIGIVATLCGLLLLRDAPPQPGQRFDLPGSVLFMALVISLLLTLTQGGQLGWAAPPVLAWAAVTVVVAVAFTAVERRAAQPILEIALFRNPGFRAATAAAFLSFLAISHSQLLLPFFLQGVGGLSPAQAGLVLVTIPATTLVLAPAFGSLADRLGNARWLASAGLLGTATGLFSLTTLTPETPPSLVAARLLLIALGMACFNSPNASALFGSLPRERYGVVGAYMSLTRNLGQSIGQTIAASLWTLVVLLSAGGIVSTADASTEALMAGFRFSFTVAAGIAVAGAVVSFVARPRAAPATTPPAATGSRQPAGRGGPAAD